MKLIPKENYKMAYDFEDSKKKYKHLLNKKRKKIIEKYKIKKEIAEKEKEIAEKVKQIAKKEKEKELLELVKDKCLMSLIEIDMKKKFILNNCTKKSNLQRK